MTTKKDNKSRSNAPRNQNSEPKPHRRKTQAAHAAARTPEPAPEGAASEAPVQAPRRDIAEIPELANALDFFNDQNLDRVTAKDFLTKCMATMRANDILMKITLPRNLSTPGRCYISHPPEDEVTIWENNQIVDHMNLQDAKDADIPPCSSPRRR